MVHFLALPLALALMAAPPSSISVETAQGDWSHLPRLDQGPYDHLNSVMMAKLYEISSEGRCRLPGFVANRLDFGVSFAAQFSPDGSVRRIVIPKYNCPEAEAVIGGALVEMIQGRDFRPTGKNANGWYRGSFTFGFEGMDPISY
jgi:hypothetical protein